MLQNVLNLRLNMAVIIFDFDGTIADSRDSIINFLAKEANIALTIVERHKLYGLSVINVAKELGFHWWNLPSLLLKGRKQMGMDILHVKPFKGINEVIKKLHAEGHELFIVSSNNIKNIRTFLKYNQLNKHFVEIYGGIEIFGKATIFRQLIKEHNFSKADVYCIGDETRDIEAGQSIGLHTIAVSWGFASMNNLVEAEPMAIANNPEEIITILEEV